MNANRRTLLAVAAGAVIGLLLLAGIFLFLNFSGYFGINANREYRSPMMGQPNLPLRRYASNGERIYLSATSESGDPIRGNRSGMYGMMSGGMACVDCHGADGRGGTIRMMMGTFTAPDIRYATLTGVEHGSEEGEEEHPPYTDETIKRAITEGVDPAGEELESPMPRWEMSESDLNDLLDYLKTLK